jgi:predicted nucleotidyltransferase
MNRDDILAVLHQFKQDYAEHYSILKIGVFGSIARDEAREDSDVDIVFETNEPNLFRTASMKAELENLLARRVDVVRLRKRMNPHLKQRILREARFV